MSSCCAYNPGLIGVGSKARIGARDIVGDDRIAALAGQFTLSVLHDVIGLGCKSDNTALALLARELSQNIDGLDELDAIEAFVGLFEFMVRRGRRCVVGDSGRANGRIGRLEGAQRRLEHLCGGLHAHTLHAAGNIERCRSQHERDLGTAACGLPRQGDAHLAR